MGAQGGADIVMLSCPVWCLGVVLNVFAKEQPSARCMASASATCELTHDAEVLLDDAADEEATMTQVQMLQMRPRPRPRPGSNAHAVPGTPTINARIISSGVLTDPSHVWPFARALWESSSPQWLSVRLACVAAAVAILGIVVALVAAALRAAYSAALCAEDASATTGKVCKRSREASRLRDMRKVAAEALMPFRAAPSCTGPPDTAPPMTSQTPPPGPTSTAPTKEEEEEKIDTVSKASMSVEFGAETDSDSDDGLYEELGVVADGAAIAYTASNTEHHGTYRHP